MIRKMIRYKYNDGGRKEAGFKGTANDCVVRAIAIALEKPYRQVYDELKIMCRKQLNGDSVRSGIGRKLCSEYLRERGWKRTPRKTHLSADELPQGRIICLLNSRAEYHLVAVIDGVIHDTFDPSREGKRVVYGYYSFCSPVNAERDDNYVWWYTEL
jgi:hypothetical protein